MAYCPHCMRRVTVGKSCPYCKKPLGQQGDEKHLPVGEVLQSGSGRKYTLGLARGQGGFGITYVALDQQTGQRVAIKEYYPVRCVDRAEDHTRVVVKPGMESTFHGGMESFIKEGTMLFQLNTLPCVVHVQDWFKANDTAYLVMEFLDGTPLHRLVAAEHRIPTAQLMPLLKPILRDLEQLHEADIIHRDIAPDNIMLMPDGTPKLLDFGSARAMENNKSMTVMLKQGFTPIEQYLSHGKQGPWTDVYALSATFYYCLTGVIPTAAPDRLYDEGALQPPSALGAEGLLPGEEAALLAGLRVQPVMRPQSVAEFAALFPERGPESVAAWTPALPVQTETAPRETVAKPQPSAPPSTPETLYIAPSAAAATPAKRKEKRYRLWFGILLAVILVLAVWLIFQLSAGRAETVFQLAARPGGSLPAVVSKGVLHHV